MSVKFTWDDPEQTQLRFVFDEMWQIDDLAQAIYLSKQFVIEQDAIIDVIMDMSAGQSIPSNLARLRDHLKSFESEGIGVIVFITDNIYIKKVMALLNQLLYQYFTMYFTDTLEDAHRIIRRAAITRQNRV